MKNLSLKFYFASPGVNDAFHSESGGSQSKKSTTTSFFPKTLFLGSITESCSVAFARSVNRQVNGRQFFFLTSSFGVLKLDGMVKLT